MSSTGKVNRRKLTGNLKIVDDTFCEISKDSCGKKKTRRILGYIRNPLYLLSGIGLVETYNTRVAVSDDNEFEDIVVKRHLCGMIRVV